MKSTRKPVKKAPRFTAAEREAMKERVRELSAGSEDGESEVLAKLAAMPEPDRTLGRRLHEIITTTAPALTPKLWYGMPAYARAGRIVCHFQGANKFKTRYAMLGFSDKANLDEGDVWPVYFAVSRLTPAAEATIRGLVERAAKES